MFLSRRVCNTIVGRLNFAGGFGLVDSFLLITKGFCIASWRVETGKYTIDHSIDFGDNLFVRVLRATIAQFLLSGECNHRWMTIKRRKYGINCCCRLLATQATSTIHDLFQRQLQPAELSRDEKRVREVLDNRIVARTKKSHEEQYKKQQRTI